MSLGDDVQRKELKLYLAFKRLKNFATVVAQKNRLLLYLHLDPEQVAPLPAIGRDVSQQGHWGTGDLELSLTGQADLDTAKPLILMSYEGRGAAAGATTHIVRNVVDARPPALAAHSQRDDYQRPPGQRGAVRQ